MDILFKTTKLRKLCNESKRALREWGSRRAKLVGQRLDELRATEALDNMRFIPNARCHQLHQDREGQLAVDLDHPCRLIFEPAHNPVPVKDDGGLDWTRITAITVLEVTDYHD